MAGQMNAADRDAVFSLPGNDVCADCKTKAPQWASVTFGSLLCLECSGAHRGLGVHITFVRSITMDSWSPKQVAMMKSSGNGQLRQWFEKHRVAHLPIPHKYHAPPAELYKARAPRRSRRRC
jgi:ADP-ribosylation factor GTPase-activating protein 1